MWPFERPNAPTSHIGGSGPVTGYTCFETNFRDLQLSSFLRLQEEWCALGQHPGPTSRGESGGRSQTFQAAACTAAPNLPPFHAPGDMTTAPRESSSRPPRGARLLEEPKDLVVTAPEVGAKRAAVSGGECLDRGHNRG